MSSHQIVPVKKDGVWVHYSVGGTNFIVDEKYELQKLIGIGAYGLVCSAINNETQERVAIKKISNAFDNLKYTKRTLREIKILRHFCHENILSLRDIMPSFIYHESNSVYIVTELMDTDLHQIIASQQQLSVKHIQYFLYQILRALKYIHSANVLHRDLKPSNLLINSDCTLKVCDFGMSRVSAPSDDEEGNSIMTEYVATRWYRAPEVILSWNHYSKAVDVWSVGCTFAELLGGKPLFPGTDYIHQINCIADIIGTPTESDLESIQNENARRYVLSLGYKENIPLNAIFPDATEEAIDLLTRMLTWDPSKRITIDEALAHPYLKDHVTEEEEPTCSPFNFDFEQYELDQETFKNLIYEETLHFRPELMEYTRDRKSVV